MGLLESKIKELENIAEFEGKRAIVTFINITDIPPGTWCMFWDKDTDSFTDVAIAKYGDKDEAEVYPHNTESGTGYHYAEPIPEDMLDKLKSFLPAKIFM